MFATIDLSSCRRDVFRRKWIVKKVTVLLVFLCFQMPGAFCEEKEIYTCDYHCGYMTEDLRDIHELSLIHI